MAPTTTTPSPPRARARRLRLAAIGFFAAGLVAIPTAAWAHHGWSGFQTNNLVYLSGTVSSEGEWGDPHSEFDVTVDQSSPARTPSDLMIPQELSGPEDSVRVQAAPAYAGPHDDLEVIIAPPWWSSNNGLDRSLEVGERFQGVGYISSADDELFRPVAFWYGDDNAPVNQVIGDTLPVRAPLPGQADTGAAPAEVPSSVQDPTELAGPSRDSIGDASSAVVVWAVFGAVAVALAAGGAIHIRRRTVAADAAETQRTDA